MEAISSTQQFIAGQEIATFLVSCGLMSKAWQESRLANKSESFILNEYEGVVYVTFPSFHIIEGFIVKESNYGEDNIQTAKEVFSGCLKGNDDRPALVHQGALKLFLNIMEKTDFQEKLQIYTDSKQRKLKTIIFVGHSLGGAVATLATLWLLEKRLRQSSPFCITFGCPLVGDVRLFEAVMRENWASNFCHVVSNNDIVPRMLLAPFESIFESLTVILPYWQDTIQHPYFKDVGRTLLDNVLHYTDTVANGPDIWEPDGVNERRSPYRPFGTYMFCSSHGAVCIENYMIVLKMLHLTMQRHEIFSDEIVQACILEHIQYDSLLGHVIQNSISGRRIGNSNSESPYELEIDLQLEAVGVGIQIDPADLDPDGETESKYVDNLHIELSVKKCIIAEIERYKELCDTRKYVDNLHIELSIKKSTMAELEWYKEACEKRNHTTYYDSLRSQTTRSDIDATHRVSLLARFWDDIIEMWENHDLPSEFHSQITWINAGTTYRRLVEPLDIANYYYFNSNGNYLSDGRPNRYKVLQKWMEEKENTSSSRRQKARTKPASLTQDSCFWAHVEEALKDLKFLKQGQHQNAERLEVFEAYVTGMINDRNISSDVFLEGSSFIIWWEEWKAYKKNQFPEWSSALYQIMETESWSEFESIGRSTVGQEIISSSGEVKENISCTKEEIISSGGEVKENISCTQGDIISSSGEVKENISCTKESNLAQLKAREIELAEQRGIMFQVELYKMSGQDKGEGYYDSFKNQMDTNANLYRVTLGEFWDGIIKMSGCRALPSDFKSKNKWINAGTSYRKLVEPMDIAHYYRTSNRSGNYLQQRPARHRVLQQWLEDREKSSSSRRQKPQKPRKKLPFLTGDSCFWAHVEEALKDLEQVEASKDLEQGLHQKKESFEKFEDHVTSMINDRNISSDVFLEKSSFMTWWQRYKQIQLQSSGWKLSSPLYKPMESEFWK